MIEAVGTKGYVGVLMVIQMPEMDVLTATAAIRKGWTCAGYSDYRFDRNFKEGRAENLYLRRKER